MNLVELYFNTLDQEMLFKVANRWKVNIKGFANITRVPEIMLRKNLIQKFNNKPDMFNKLLEEVYGTKIKEMKIDSIEDFLYTFLSYPLKDKVPTHFALGILIFLYPEFAEQKLNILNENILNNRHIFDGCIEDLKLTKENSAEVISKLLQLKEPFDYFSMFDAEIETALKTLKLFDKYEKLKSVFKDYDLYEFAKYFIENRNTYPDYVMVFAYLSNISDEEFDSNRDFYNKLYTDAHICLDIEAFRHFEELFNDLSQKNNNLEREINNKEERLVSLEKQLNEFEEKYIVYKNEINKTVENLKSQVEAKIKETENLTNLKREFNLSFENTIITGYGYDRIFDSIGRCNVVSFEELNNLNYLEGYKGLVIIHKNSIVTTKDLLLLEKKLKGNNIKFTVIFGVTIEEMVRNIIIKKSKLGV
ncbi:hypothetical protein ABG79_00235 [Caloramator mitchellensis]|uniref:Uncharacterized protein n=1 Tax=Caloramator mitchellensis TaxID=908809 RepID=A0A0R3K3S4_CALMK|nr:hypothetical protein [Caloramator mitchellensis]KRQ88068.1 hypothetical protein ABG79_00235 [Caloramator mitchellensis]